MEVHDTVQEVVIKTITKRKKCKKAKWLSEEALAEKRREVKGKREKQRDVIFPAISVSKDVTVISSCSHHRWELGALKALRKGKNSVIRL